MDSEKFENQLSSNHGTFLKKTIYNQASRYLEAMLGFYLTKNDNNSAIKIRKIIRELKVIHLESK